MTQIKSPVEVTIIVNVEGTEKTFEAEGTTLGDPHNLAYGVLTGVAEDARRWIGKEQDAARVAARQALHSARMGARR